MVRLVLVETDKTKDTVSAIGGFGNPSVVQNMMEGGSQYRVHRFPSGLRLSFRELSCMVSR